MNGTRTTLNELLSSDRLLEIPIHHSFRLHSP